MTWISKKEQLYNESCFNIEIMKYLENPPLTFSYYFSPRHKISKILINHYVCYCLTESNIIFYWGNDINDYGLLANSGKIDKINSPIENELLMKLGIVDMKISNTFCVGKNKEDKFFIWGEFFGNIPEEIQISNKKIHNYNCGNHLVSFNTQSNLILFQNQNKNLKNLKIFGNSLQTIKNTFIGNEIILILTTRGIIFILCREGIFQINIDYSKIMACNIKIINNDFYVLCLENNQNLLIHFKNLRKYDEPFSINNYRVKYYTVNIHKQVKMINTEWFNGGLFFEIECPDKKKDKINCKEIKLFVLREKTQKINLEKIKNDTNFEDIFTFNRHKHCISNITSNFRPKSLSTFHTDFISLNYSKDYNECKPTITNINKIYKGEIKKEKNNNDKICSNCRVNETKTKKNSIENDTDLVNYTETKQNDNTSIGKNGAISIEILKNQQNNLLSNNLLKSATTNSTIPEEENENKMKKTKKIINSEIIEEKREENERYTINDENDSHLKNNEVDSSNLNSIDSVKQSNIDSQKSLVLRHSLIRSSLIQKQNQKELLNRVNKSNNGNKTERIENSKDINAIPLKLKIGESLNSFNSSSDPSSGRNNDLSIKNRNKNIRQLTLNLEKNSTNINTEKTYLTTPLTTTYTYPKKSNQTDNDAVERDKTNVLNRNIILKQKETSRNDPNNKRNKTDAQKNYCNTQSAKVSRKTQSKIKDNEINKTRNKKPKIVNDNLTINPSSMTAIKQKKNQPYKLLPSLENNNFNTVDYSTTKLASQKGLKIPKTKKKLTGMFLAKTLEENEENGYNDINNDYNKNESSQSEEEAASNISFTNMNQFLKNKETSSLISVPFEEDSSPINNIKKTSKNILHLKSQEDLIQILQLGENKNNNDSTYYIINNDEPNDEQADNERKSNKNYKIYKVKNNKIVSEIKQRNKKQFLSLKNIKNHLKLSTISSDSMSARSKQKTFRTFSPNNDNDDYEYYKKNFSRFEMWLNRTPANVTEIPNEKKSKKSSKKKLDIICKIKSGIIPINYHSRNKSNQIEYKTANSTKKNSLPQSMDFGIGSGLFNEIKEKYIEFLRQRNPGKNYTNYNLDEIEKKFIMDIINSKKAPTISETIKSDNKVDKSISMKNINSSSSMNEHMVAIEYEEDKSNMLQPIELDQSSGSVIFRRASVDLLHRRNQAPSKKINTINC